MKRCVCWCPVQCSLEVGLRWRKVGGSASDDGIFRPLHVLVVTNIGAFFQRLVGRHMSSPGTKLEHKFGHSLLKPTAEIRRLLPLIVLCVVLLLISMWFCIFALIDCSFSYYCSFLLVLIKWVMFSQFDHLLCVALLIVVACFCTVACHGYLYVCQFSFSFR